MNNWISVKDKLPTKYDWVLISYVDGKDSKLRYVPSVGEYRNGVWCTKESDEFFSNTPRHYVRDFESAYLVKVTHWMPLPEPPRYEHDK